ncbi:bifunctional DNA-formamidopyrimidine glycosylase/DNA-(apurinic or apyrimidinic site) lyase [Candidatus Pelagibacter communis]|uniref:bifunctional DNA-formamidopyrimidine glycosylase/DNA-(apurinic or apyrimidinic site) lyase n=1 Tax=Pelagibacter ubique TaxID=198252 RepID=UPI00094DBEAB|nr:bifunctional DNA-formamidopyrimidine glycosylase/DNA-(apurinic or apyrimidinic site) lyase [Candidatus Pelagibacter ubique]|tara:strand:+ start:217 stop:1080 length:864 start_codon:yes stop_codon:yes gene_type:complete
MPELPEVEIVRQSLNKKISKKKVKKVIIRNKNLRIKIPNNFGKFIENKIVKNVSRFSKYLIINFPNNQYCLIHLGMSGTIHFIKNNDKKYKSNLSFYHSPFLPEKHNHVELIFNKFRIIYNDPRRFGFFQIITSFSDLEKKFAHLGPEPFNKKFDLNYFYQYSKGKNKKIRDLLIDQKFVSGIGNIYANEILFLCRIKPYKKIKFLNKENFNQIIINSKKILSEAINKGGSSIKDFKNTEGDKGGFQDNFKVYQREGLTCKRFSCRGKIIKKRIGNRSIFFCNSCQI